MNPLRNPKLMKHIPFVTTGLLESANVAQMYRMWTEWTAEGQSVWGWIFVNLALILWYNWYALFAPEQKSARIATGIGIFMNSCVILSVIYFRYA